MPVREAVEVALERGVDLVEVAPNAQPPVCRLLDYGRFRYEQSKKEKANRARSKTLEMKEVRLGRSMKIDPHDIQIRLNQARKFLMDGHKVWVSHYTQELQCCKLTRYDRCEHCEYIDLFHGDTIHLVPPRVSWELSFTLRAEVRSVRGVEMDDDGELVAMRRLRGRRRRRK